MGISQDISEGGGDVSSSDSIIETSSEYEDVMDDPIPLSTTTDDNPKTGGNTLLIVFCGVLSTVMLAILVFNKQILKLINRK